MNEPVQIQDGRVKFHIVYALWVMPVDLFQRAEDTAGNQKDFRPFRHLAKRQMGNSLHVEITGGK